MAENLFLTHLAALDVAVRAHLPLALAAEAELARGRSSLAAARALAVLRRNGELRALRREARAAAGVDDAERLDGCTGDAGDAGGGW